MAAMLWRWRLSSCSFTRILTCQVACADSNGGWGNYYGDNYGGYNSGGFPTHLPQSRILALPLVSHR